MLNSVSVWSRSVVSNSLRPPGSSVHGILQARILEWVAISFSRGSSQPRDGTWVSSIAGRCFILWATREVLNSVKGRNNIHGLPRILHLSLILFFFFYSPITLSVNFIILISSSSLSEGDKERRVLCTPPSGGHLATSGHIRGCHNPGGNWHLVFRGYICY